MRTPLDHQRIRHDGRLHLLALLPAQRRLYASVDLRQRLVADNQHNNPTASDCSDGGFPGVVHGPPEHRRRKDDGRPCSTARSQSGAAASASASI